MIALASNRIDPHPADCRCSDCMGMAAVADRTLNLNLAQVHNDTANGGESSAAPLPIRRHLEAGDSLIIPARGGVVRTADLAVGTRAGRQDNFKEATQRGKAAEPGIIEAARPVVIKEILALHRGDLKDARAYARYLKSLNFVALCARRDHLKREAPPMQLDLHPKYGGAE